MSKRTTEAAKLIDPTKLYSVTEALELVKKASTAKFDESVETHFRLNIDPKQTDQKVRTQIMLPHGIGKTLRVAAFVSPAKEKEAKEAGADMVGGEDLIKQIKQTEKTDFDIAVAEAAMMKNLAGVAKILGQKGLMPNPKTGTVGDEIGRMVKDLKSGNKVDLKTDDSGNIHQVIGKVSFETEKLLENFQATKEAIYKAKPSSVKKDFMGSITITSSMGPGIKVSK